jgi:hypothetical protein
MNNKPFKKGELVITYSGDRREIQVEHKVVTSVGEKYVTVMSVDSAGKPWGRKEQYSVITRYLKDYQSRQLFHDEQELQEDLKEKELVTKFHRLADVYGFNREEIKPFMEIHEAGIGSWKNEHYKA